MRRFVVPIWLLPLVLLAQQQTPGNANLARIGTRAASSGAYTTAVYYLEQVVAAEPTHPTAWNMLCRAYLELDRVAAAIEACHRQLEIAPNTPAAYGVLARALWLTGERGEALAAAARRAELSPRDTVAHAVLGHYRCELDKFTEAIPELEAAISIQPGNVAAHIDLGGAYLAVGQQEKGLAMLAQVIQEHPEPAEYRGVAHQLAVRGVSLDLAKQYAESAIAALTAKLASDEIDPAKLPTLHREVQLADAWSTLGWIHLQLHDLDSAQEFLAAAWALDPHGSVADHLGQLAEARGQKAQAMEAYAWALAAPRPFPASRQHLEALAPAGDSDRLVAEAAKQLLQMRTLSAGALLPDPASAVFQATQSQDPGPARTQFLRGDAALQEFTKAVADRMPPGVFPSPPGLKLARRAVLKCPGQSAACSLELLSAGAAVSAELNAVPPETDIAKAAANQFASANGVTPPVPIYRPEPQYSKKALKKKLEGTIILSVMIDRTGHPRDIKVIRSLGLGLDEMAVAAVSRWQFKPGTKDGEPVETRASIEVNFRLMH